MWSRWQRTLKNWRSPSANTKKHLRHMEKQYSKFIAQTLRGSPKILPSSISGSALLKHRKGMHHHYVQLLTDVSNKWNIGNYLFFVVFLLFCVVPLHDMALYISKDRLYCAISVFTTSVMAYTRNMFWMLRTGVSACVNMQK